MHRDNHDSKLLISATTQSARLRDPRRESTPLPLIDSAITNSSERQFWKRRYATLRNAVGPNALSPLGCRSAKLPPGRESHAGVFPRFMVTEPPGPKEG